MRVEDPATAGASGPAASFEAQVAGIAALAEPVRRALYDHVVSEPEPVSREQAAAATGVARHVAKFHLDKLVDDGLLDFEYRRPPERRGPGAGRPAKVYRRSQREISVTLPERHYELAGRLLAAAVTEAERDGGPVAEALQRNARAAGRALAHKARQRAGGRSGSAARHDAVLAVLGESGYEPRREPGGVSLVNCPFHALARDYPDLVCGLNLDLLQGLVSGLDRTDLQARLDPGPGRCCVRLDQAQ